MTFIYQVASNAIPSDRREIRATSEAHALEIARDEYDIPDGFIF